MKTELGKKIDLIKDRLMSFDDLAPNGIEVENLSRAEAEKKGFFSRDFGMKQWDWPQGVGIFGLRRTGNANDAFIEDWADEEISKGLPLKNVNTVCPMLTLVEFEKYDELCQEWMEWIEAEFPRTEEGGLQHITSGVDKYTLKANNQQIWVDTLFMTILFVAKMGVKHNNQAWIDDSAYQVLVHSKYLLDREESLFYHGWNFETRSNYNGNFWCRGNSWITVGLPLYLSIVGERIPVFVKDYLTTMLNNQISTLVKLRADDKLWHTILNDSDSYTETSGSAGIIAGILISINQNWVTQDISKEFIDESINGILARVDETGAVHGVSAGTAISHNKEDYKGIIKTPMVYGQAMVLIALEEYTVYLENLEA